VFYLEFDLVLSKFCRHNQIGILLCKRYNAKASIILLEEKDKDKFQELKEIYQRLLPECDVIEAIIKKDDASAISNILVEYSKSKLLINLTGGEDITSLILLKKAIELNIASTYIDLLNMKRYNFGDKIEAIDEQFEDLNIDDMTRLSGVDIINDTDFLSNKKDIIKLTKLIANNLEVWEKYKNKLYDKNIFIHDYKNQFKVTINAAALDNEETGLIWRVLKFFKGLGYISYFVKESDIYLKFKNDYLKGFIFKSGTWLEVLTNIVIKDIKEIDEVKSGVEFFWSDKSQAVKNELDVVAVKDSVLICISCKDSGKYDEDALNELEVYSSKIGGEEVVKILVATKLPFKKNIIDRASEMDINIVIFENIDRFKQDLIEIINNSKKK
jgi:Holliday junction resolvase